MAPRCECTAEVCHLVRVQGGRWARPDLNRSRQHPKLVGYQATPRAPGLPDAGATKKLSAHPKGTTSSISSAFVRSMRRQQYRFKPRSSRIARGLSPARARVTNGSHKDPTTFPHVKHLTGMIIGSPVRFLPLLPCPAPKGVLR